MIAPYFLPRRRVGALRPFKFAIHLQKYGWEPHIITIDSEGTLTSKEQQLLQNISVYRLHSPLDRTDQSGSQLNHSSIKKQENQFSIGDWIDKHFPVDTWLPFFMLKMNSIKKIAREINPDAVWSTGDPWSAHWVGKSIAKMLPDIFWMADFRDPWTLSATNLKQRSAFSAALDSKIERYIIQQASMLSFTTNSTRMLYENHYSDLNPATVTIYNAFDKKLFNSEEKEISDLEMKSENLNLIFFGRFRRLSPARPVIDVLSELKRNNGSLTDKIRIYSFGQLSDEDHNYAVEKGVEHCFICQDPVPVEQGLQILHQTDLLLLSTKPEREDIIPAKFWDYLATDRPIISIAPNPEIQQILEETGTGVQFDSYDVQKIAGLLKKCIIAKEAGNQLPISISRNQQVIDQYSAEWATAKLANILDQHTV